MTGGRLDAQRVHDQFQELSERLQVRGERATLFVVGGAAMALAYDEAPLDDPLHLPPHVQV